jgi:hypothetical protein
MNKKHHAHRVDTNIYEYRGFQIECVGYYPPEHRVVWEAVDHDGSGFAHAFTLRECKIWVDKELDKTDK